MNKRQLWFVCSLALILVVMSSSIFTVVHSAINENPASDLNHFNFLTTSRDTGKIITTEIDPSTNQTTYQTMKINEKFAFKPENEAYISSIEMGENAISHIQLVVPSTNFVIVPIRITNNMTDLATATIRFLNVSSSILRDNVQYEVYDYSSKSFSKPYKLNEVYNINYSLMRCEYKDICIVVHLENANNINLETVDTLYFSVSIEMKQV